jgi:hypothetical protein
MPLELREKAAHTDRPPAVSGCMRWIAACHAVSVTRQRYQGRRGTTAVLSAAPRAEAEIPLNLPVQNNV